MDGIYDGEWCCYSLFSCYAGWYLCMVNWQGDSYAAVSIIILAISNAKETATFTLPANLPSTSLLQQCTTVSLAHLVCMCVYVYVSLCVHVYVRIYVHAEHKIALSVRIISKSSVRPRT